MSKPRIFIGSSVEGLTIAYAVQQNLTHDAEITVWDQGVFELSQTTIESLVSILEKSDFAIFVFSPDDIIKIRKKEHLAVRDNVIFELGLFIGKLGRQRSFIVMPDKPAFHIPTDLIGITAGKYDTSRADGSYQAATGPVSHQIRIQIKKLGVLQAEVNESVSQEIVALESIDASQKEADWFDLFIQKKYNEALKLIERKIEDICDEDKSNLLGWKFYLEYKLDPKHGKEMIIERIKANPNDKDNYAVVSRFLLWENELSLASKIIDEGLDKFKKDDILIFRKTDYLARTGRNEEAISLILSTNYEEDEDLAIKLADLYEGLEVKKLEEAFSVVKKAYNSNPASERLTFKLARLAQELDKNVIALYLLDALTKKYSKNVSYWGYLGNSCAALDLINKAMVSYKKAMELSESKEAWIIANIGNILNNQGFYSWGREYFNMALELDSNSKYSFDRVSRIIKNEEEESEKYIKLLKDGLNSVL